MDPDASHDKLAAWIGHTRHETDVIRAVPVAQLAATLGRDDPLLADPHPGVPLPPLWHWVFFTPRTPAADLGPDGHERLGGFLPPVELPRRMWAGGRITWHDALMVGDVAMRTSTVADVKARQGRSGALVFVTLRHTLATRRGPAITEEHDIVYRERPSPDAPAAVPPPDAQLDDLLESPRFEHAWQPDAVMLFRYSALTFNGHRIHYDRDWAVGQEGYPGLVVHGPLIATLLFEGLHRTGPQPAGGERHLIYRALAPVFDGQTLTVRGGQTEDGWRLQALAGDRMAMVADLHTPAAPAPVRPVGPVGGSQ